LTCGFGRLVPTSTAAFCARAQPIVPTQNARQRSEKSG
jgi:hypothetical protein